MVQCCDARNVLSHVTHIVTKLCIIIVQYRFHHGHVHDMLLLLCRRMDPTTTTTGSTTTTTTITTITACSLLLLLLLLLLLCIGVKQLEQQLIQFHRTLRVQCRPRWPLHHGRIGVMTRSLARLDGQTMKYHSNIEKDSGTDEM